MRGGWPGLGGDGEWARRVSSMRREQPHYKPAMLLAALDLVAAGECEPARVLVTLLVRRFQAILRAARLDGERSAHMPLWHLSAHSPTRQPFWTITTRTGGPPARQPRSPTSIESVSFLPELAPALASPWTLWLARQAIYGLLDADPRPEACRLLEAWPDDLGELRAEESRLESLLRRPFRLDDDLADRVSSSESRVVRHRAFSKLVTEAYDHCCALCGDRIRWRESLRLVEAAHVKPRALLGTDDPRNGLALCPSHHWAFDHYLWTFDERLVVEVRKPGDGDDLAALERFRSGARLRTPANPGRGVHRDAIDWHSRQFAAD